MSVAEPDRGHDAIADLLSCGICMDLVFQPVTLMCCGRAFCKICLRRCLLAKAKIAAQPFCPGGCGAKLPYRLPPVSRLLEELIEKGSKKAYEKRREEMSNDPAGEDVKVYGGFHLWQEVVAGTNLKVASSIAVTFGTPGIIVSAEISDGRISVMFDEFTDAMERTIHVFPWEIRLQLSPKYGLRVGQRVYATRDLMFGHVVGVRRFGQGVVLAAMDSEDRIVVQFDERDDGNAGCIAVCIPEVAPWKVLPGGFLVGQRVEACLDLRNSSGIMVRKGVKGVVWGQYGLTRFSVRFDEREDGLAGPVNVVPKEVKPSKVDAAPAQIAQVEPTAIHQGEGPMVLQTRTTSIRRLQLQLVSRLGLSHTPTVSAGAMSALLFSSLLCAAVSYKQARARVKA